jgi:hypothetical protein
MTTSMTLNFIQEKVPLFKIERLRSSLEMIVRQKETGIQIDHIIH